jgi:hypothetical protein
MTREEIAEINPDALVCDGFDEAIIGMAERINLGPVVAYNVEKIISIMIERDGMTYEEALEFFNYNILGAWMGEFTPIFITTGIEQ